MFLFPFKDVKKRYKRYGTVKNENRLKREEKKKKKKKKETMKKLLIERKSKPSSSGNGNGGSGTSPAQAPAFKEDCFALEDVPILRGDRAELGTETPFGNNVIGFIGKAGVGKTTLAEIVAGCRPMSAPEGPRDGDLGSDPFGVTARCANGMVVLDSSSILSGILPPLKAPSPSLSLSLIYVPLISLTR